VAQGYGTALEALKALDADLATRAAAQERELKRRPGQRGLFGFMVVVLGAVLSVVQSVKVTGPIKSLTAQASRTRERRSRCAGGDHLAG